MSGLLKQQKLGLGTVQFGLPYGMTNESGQLDQREVAAVLNLAQERGIQLLDTGRLYGEAEKVIGECLDASGATGFRIVTKTPAFEGKPINDDDIDVLRAGFEQSLADLGVAQVYGLMVHHAEDLLCNGGERIFECLLQWRQQGRCQRIGASVYNRGQIDQILARYPIDLVQVPFNVFDQRLLHDGTLGRLKAAGVEVHARSIFLQGVVLSDPQRLPDRFQPYLDLLMNFGETVASAGGTRLAGALDFVRGITEIDGVIVGVSCLSEFRDILDAYDKEPLSPIDYLPFACNDENLINPMRWSETA
jgi:aryl-alcohol dehydrogenase-like predicted oxidoreductase